MLDRASWVSLVPFVALCLGAGRVVSILARGAVHTWYPQLRKPGWNPPTWIFGPVWRALYVLMALSAWLVWRTGNAGTVGALALFWLQLLLNMAWAWIFFRMRAIGRAFGEILLLWTMVVATTVAFLPISFLAAWLLIPYLGAVGFASYLNFRIWQLN